MKPVYSICITHRNNRETLVSALRSILSQIDERYEVIVVDGRSTDGSVDILEELANSGIIRLISTKCTRGKGRQIAFENSKGTYLIANLDMDETYQPRLAELMRVFHEEAEDKILLVTASENANEIDRQNITIGSRALVSEIGGWRNLNYGEDWDLWHRASKVGRFRWTVFPLIVHHNQHSDRERLLLFLKLRYVRYKEMIRLGRQVFSDGGKVTPAQRGVYLLAKVGARFGEGPLEDSASNFNPHDERHRLNRRPESREQKWKPC
jgi:glycosyltransferase involved in cell wall biosynthesis